MHEQTEGQNFKECGSWPAAMTARMMDDGPGPTVDHATTRLCIQLVNCCRRDHYGRYRRVQIVALGGVTSLHYLLTELTLIVEIPLKS